MSIWFDTSLPWTGTDGGPCAAPPPSRGRNAAWDSANGTVQRVQRRVHRVVQAPAAETYRSHRR
ncbi:MAG: hypothetical protein JWP76_2977 [Dactylosporangium sp.]|jgi:hypothetical protein|nr:hypothetical protein [Dactylosporangium sp.]